MLFKVAMCCLNSSATSFSFAELTKSSDTNKFLHAEWVGCLSAVYACVYVCEHCKTTTAGHIHIVIKFGRWILHDESWSSISFEVRRSSVKVGVSLHSFDCQSSSLRCRLCGNYWAAVFVWWKFANGTFRDWLESAVSLRRKKQQTEIKKEKKRLFQMFCFRPPMNKLGHCLGHWPLIVAMYGAI